MHRVGWLCRGVQLTALSHCDRCEVAASVAVSGPFCERLHTLPLPGSLHPSCHIVWWRQVPFSSAVIALPSWIVPAWCHCGNSCVPQITAPIPAEGSPEALHRSAQLVRGLPGAPKRGGTDAAPVCTFPFLWKQEGTVGEWGGRAGGGGSSAQKSV